MNYRKYHNFFFIFFNFFAWQVCYNKEENNAEGCDNPDDTTEGYCAYCCATPGCNAELPPYRESPIKSILSLF